MISVIVPIFNVKAYIYDCIVSILNQSYTEFELLLVDDGSTDGCSLICDEFLEKDHRVRVIHQENHGLSEARNTGINHSTGDFLTFIDSDDVVLPQFLEVLYQNLMETKADISVCGFCYIKEQEKAYDAKNMQQREKIRKLSGKEAVAKIVCDQDTNYIVAWGKLYRREIFETLRYPAGKCHEDEFTTYLAFDLADHVVYDRQPLYLYRKRTSSIMGAYKIRNLDKLEALQEAYERLTGDLKNAAARRYVLAIQIAYYKLTRSLPGEVARRKNLLSIYRAFYKQHKKEIRSEASVVDKMTMFFFRLHPDVYGIFARMYETFQSLQQKIKRH